MIKTGIMISRGNNVEEIISKLKDCIKNLEAINNNDNLIMKEFSRSTKGRFDIGLSFKFIDKTIENTYSVERERT